MTATENSTPKTTGEPLVLHQHTDDTANSRHSWCFLCATWVKYTAAQLLQPSVGADCGRWENWRVERTWADTARDKNYSWAFADNNIVIMPRGWFACESEDMKNSHVGAMTWFSEKRCCPSCRSPILNPHVGKHLLLKVQDTKSKPALADCDPWTPRRGKYRLLIISLMCRYVV